MGKLNKHLKEVVNVTWNAANRCDTSRDHMFNAILGLVGEAGEVADLVKKMEYHKVKEGYRKEVLLEMGDVIYYWLKLKELFGFTIEQILEANKKKLFERYSVNKS